MVKLGIIGLGRMGGYHVSVASQIADVDLVALADCNSDHITKYAHAAPCVSFDYHEWLACVDAVIIATPTDTHYAIAKTCLMHNKHVLVEKPLTRDLIEARDLFALAEQRNLVLQVGHVERFNGAMRALSLADTKPYLIESHRMGPFSPRVARDSVVLDLMIHDLDLVLCIADAPLIDMHVQGYKVHTDSCDIASVQLKFGNGTMAHLLASRTSCIRRRSMAIHCKDAFFTLDFNTQDLIVQTALEEQKQGLELGQQSFKANPLKLEVEYFIASIQNHSRNEQQKRDLEALHLTFEVERQLGLR